MNHHLFSCSCLQSWPRGIGRHGPGSYKGIPASHTKKKKHLQKRLGKGYVSSQESSDFLSMGNCKSRRICEYWSKKKRFNLDQFKQPNDFVSSGRPLTLRIVSRETRGIPVKDIKYSETDIRSLTIPAVVREMLAETFICRCETAKSLKHGRNLQLNTYTQLGWCRQQHKRSRYHTKLGIKTKKAPHHPIMVHSRHP